jgi:glycosyltransferase involved in cell wall biosynthesis
LATVLHLITGLETGGAEQMLARLVSRLDRSRHRSIVVSMTGPGSIGPELSRGGIEVHSLDLARGSPDPRGLVRLVGLWRLLRPDVVQTWLYHADLLGLIAKPFAPACRLLWNIQCTESIDTRVVLRLLVPGSRFPEAIVVNSLAGKSFHEGLGYRPRRWEHIPNGCDTSAFRFDEAARRRLRREWGIADDTVAIGLPARYHAMKDHATFFAAARILVAVRPDAVFVLAGPEIDQLNRRLLAMVGADGLAERMRLIGDRRDMADVYSALDIATLSSAFGEGCPNVLVEAMSCATPCAATACGDAAQIIGPTGKVVPPRDPEALAAAWRELIDLGPEGRRALGAAARRRAVAQYDLDAIVRRYDALYADGEG